MRQRPFLTLFHVQNPAEKPEVLDVEHDCRSPEAIAAQTVVGCARFWETSVLKKEKEKTKGEARLALFTFSATSPHPLRCQLVGCKPLWCSASVPGSNGWP